MTPWTAIWPPPAVRDLRRLSEENRRRVIAAVERLAATGQGDVQRLRGIEPSQHRLRVGEVRVLFRFEPEAQPATLRVLHVLPRGRAYRE